jgi:hypothetical protein
MKNPVRDWVNPDHRRKINCHFVTVTSASLTTTSDNMFCGWQRTQVFPAKSKDLTLYTRKEK